MLRKVLCLVAAALISGCSAGGDQFVGTWTNPAGQPASAGEYGNDRYELQVFRGAEHCNWTSVIFVLLAWPPGTVAIPTPEGVPVPERDLRPGPQSGDRGLTYEGSLDLDAHLPEGSHATGYKHGSTELWLGPDEGERFAYLKDGDSIERWPRAIKPPGCA